MRAVELKPGRTLTDPGRLEMHRRLAGTQPSRRDRLGACEIRFSCVVYTRRCTRHQ